MKDVYFCIYFKFEKIKYFFRILLNFFKAMKNNREFEFAFAIVNYLIGNDRVATVKEMICYNENNL